MSGSGFVLLSRSLIDNGLWRMNSDIVRLFLYLMMKANHSPTKAFTFGSGDDSVTVRQGEYLRSLRQIAEDCAYTGNNKLVVWSTSQVSRMIDTLERDGRIKVLAKTKHGTHLKVVNFVAYNDFSTYSSKGLGTDLEQTRNNNNTSTIKAPNNIPSEVEAYWQIWLDELSPKKPHPKLTKKRKQVLAALHQENLSDHDSPGDLFRSILRAVKASPHHMGTRTYQLPESLFRNEERRESWTHRGLDRHKTTQQVSAVGRNWSVDA